MLVIIIVLIIKLVVVFVVVAFALTGCDVGLVVLLAIIALVPVMKRAIRVIGREIVGVEARFAEAVGEIVADEQLAPTIALDEVDRGCNHASVARVGVLWTAATRRSGGMVR